MSSLTPVRNPVDFHGVVVYIHRNPHRVVTYWPVGENCSLTREVPLEPKPSRHASELESAGIIETRPWGRWRVLGEGKGYKVKQIDVNPGCRLSLQFHHHRSEHWIVVSGTARVIIGERILSVHPQESAFVPVGASHRIENPGPLPLTIIEIQSGPYLGEDDIVRLHDDYGRGDGK